jgi:hypothetical protein
MVGGSIGLAILGNGHPARHRPGGYTLSSRICRKA